MKRLLASAAVLFLGAMSILAAGVDEGPLYTTRFEFYVDGQRISQPMGMAREGVPCTISIGGTTEAPKETGSKREFNAGFQAESVVYRSNDQLYLDAHYSFTELKQSKDGLAGVRAATSKFEIVEPITLGKKIEIDNFGKVKLVLTVTEAK